MTSSSPLLSAWPCNLLKKVSTSSISQSLLSLVNTGFQWPKFPDWSHNWATQASLEEAREYKLGKASSKESSPHHLSFQNRTLLPPPTLKATLFSKLHPPIPNRLPKPHSMTLPWNARIPTSFFLSKFPYNHLFP